MSVNKYVASQDLLLQIAGSGSEGSFHRTQVVQALAGATTVTIQDSKIHATSLVFPFADNGTNESMSAPSSITLSEGQCVLTFDALEADTDFTLVILADSIAEGDFYITDLADVQFTSLANGNLLGYNGTTQEWVNITIDSTPTQNSSNPVTSGGVYTALASKANTSDLPVLTSEVTALTGATSVTITDNRIHTTSKLIEPKASVQGLAQPTMTITEGQCLLEFSALAQDTSFGLLIYN